jgi:hypothetical protein
MTWARFDDGFPGHRKVRRLTDGAYRLHTTAICHCAHDLTDGRVTPEDVEDMPSIRQAEKRITELIFRDLWSVIPGGWMIHDYLDYNPSREQVMAERESARERKETWKAKRKAERNAVPNTVPNGVGNTAPYPYPSRTRPVPVVSTSVETSHQSLQSVPRKAANE